MVDPRLLSPEDGGCESNHSGRNNLMLLPCPASTQTVTSVSSVKEKLFGAYIMTFTH